jgi:hypothetical protein
MQRVIGPSPTGRRGFLYAAGGATALLAGCSSPVRSPAVPYADAMRASVLGLPNERFYPLGNTDPMHDEVVAALQRRDKALNLPPGSPLPELDLLAVSGGGENGAFGAGLLNAWTKYGTRPEFELVTGISTGALTAPFAFLGPAYDDQLKDVYTNVGPDQILESRGLLSAALFDDALASNAPLLGTISRYLTPEFQAAIAKQYAAGRLLLVGTTNLDAQLPVIWNIGAIAASDHPRALETIRRVLLASAAVPGAFPPSMFDVTVDGKPYQEMHVDGGAFAQAFLYPSTLTAGRRALLAKHQKVYPANAYVIRNGRLDPDWASVQRRTLGIAGRAITTMIAASGMNDVVRIYNTAMNDDVAFRLAFIGRDFTMELPSPFDQAYMRALFDYGYQSAIHGYPWADRPPGT